MSFNKSFLLGHIGQKPAIKTTDKYSVCSFSVATNEVWFDKDKNRNTSTEWHNIKAWGRLAEICSEYLTQGDQVFIEGQNCTDIKENEDGTKSYYKYIKLKEVRFVKVKKLSDISKQNENSKEEFSSGNFDESVNQVAYDSVHSVDFTANDISF